MTQAPRTVGLLNGLTAALATNTDLLVRDPTTFDVGMKDSTSVFGAQDAQGHATRISVVVGACSPGVPCTLPAGSGLHVADAFDAVVRVLLEGTR